MRLTDHFQYNAFTRFLTPKTILPVSVAHSEGRFVIPPGLLAEMQVQGLGLFQYCDADGRIIDAFPVNPNGSVQNIAAVSNKAGNVMAMVPHPERTPHGDAIFNSMREHIAKGHAGQVTPLHYQPRTLPVTQYRAAPGAIEWLVHADNEALSVENALQQYDLPVRVQRQAHWEILCDSPEVLAQIRASDVLFNAHADPLMTPAPVTTANEMAYLVRAHDDLIGLEKKQRLEHECGIRGIHSLRHSIVWRFSATQDLPALCERVMQSPILYNPHAADCYHYEAQVIRKG
jgi:phosphoribosylformylglycinamidine synthase